MSEDIAFKLSVASETWRFRAYVAFWSMCFFAIGMSNLVVKPILLAGPEDGLACPPFQRAWEEKGVSPGKGFDLSTQSHLMQAFGFNNICSNWDYSPSRELTAMVYPLFEYSLIVYLVLDFLCTYLANKRGELTKGFWAFSKIVFPINIILCSQFRMIFVCIAYENVRLHTAGFLGLQVALVLVALQNTGFIWDAGVAYEALGGLKGTRIVTLSYIIGDIIICFFKLGGTCSIVFTGVTPDFYFWDSPLPGKVMGQFMDIVWMIFNAAIPVLVSYFRSKRELKLDIVVTQNGGYESVPGGGVVLRAKYESSAGGEIM